MFAGGLRSSLLDGERLHFSQRLSTTLNELAKWFCLKFHLERLPTTKHRQSCNVAPADVARDLAALSQADP